MQILRQHVAGLEVGHDQDLRFTCDSGVDAFYPRGLRINRIVEGERAVEDGTRDLAAVGHLAKRRRVDGPRYLGGDGFDR